MSRRYNPYPKRRNARGRAEMRRQRTEHRLRVALRMFWETAPRRMYLPPNFTPYDGPVLGNQSVRFVREGGSSLPEEP